MARETWPWPDGYLPLPWRVEEDWTAEILAANGRCIVKLPLERLAEAHAIVRTVNLGGVETEGEEQAEAARKAEERTKYSTRDRNRLFYGEKGED